jgi:hypothetical protein
MTLYFYCYLAIILTVNCLKAILKKNTIGIEYGINKSGYGLKAGIRDETGVGIMDPLLASTFIGSNSYDDDYGPSMLIDDDGNIYLCGYTSSATFPSVNGYDPSYNGGLDIFIAKFNPDLSVLLSSTFIGGTGNEYEATMAFDRQKQNIYVSGYTVSVDFPCTANAYDKTNNGGMDAVVSVFDHDLTQLKASTYLGGAFDDRALDILLDGENHIYIAGYSKSNNFPYTDMAYDTVNSGSAGDCFISKFTQDLTSDVVGISQEDSYPHKKDGGLYNYPNPFKTETTLCFMVKSAAVVRLDILSDKGDSATTLINTQLSPGLHSAGFSAVGLENGVCYGVLSTAEEKRYIKMVVAE